MKKTYKVLLVVGLVSIVGLQASFYSPASNGTFSTYITTMSQRDPKDIPWFVAAQTGNLNAMKNQFNTLTDDQKKIMINAHDKNGEPVLIHGVIHGHRKVVTWAIKNGADLTKTNHVSVNSLEAVADIISSYLREIIRLNRNSYQTERFKKAVIKKALRR
jgi:hypothetical protein